MKHSVSILPRARIQLYEAALWWAENRSQEQAARWLQGFEDALESLKNDPHRFALAPENDEFPFTIRQLLYGLGTKKTHRAIFEVRGEEVVVHAVRHLAQKDITPEAL